ncbi:MAG: hypothetical protein AAGE96_07195, partial [Cyanobacteria bacterium P01_G01_bin.19]
CYCLKCAVDLRGLKLNFFNQAIAPLSRNEFASSIKTVQDPKKINYRPSKTVLICEAVSFRTALTALTALTVVRTYL